PAESRQAMDEVAGSGPRRSFRLSTNYRSPAEVFDVAAPVVQRAFPGADLPRAIRETGVRPVLAEVAGDDLLQWLDRQVGELAGQVAGTIGVIAPPSRLAGLREAAAGLPNLAAITDRLALVSPLGAKGLEYDAVVVVSPDEI